MKRLFVLVILVLCVALGLIIHRARAPISKAFCTGLPVNLYKIEIEGQGRRAIITEETALKYLAKAPKFGALQDGFEFKDGLSFQARLYGDWPSKGDVHIIVSTDKRVLDMAYFESAFSDSSFSFCILDSNMPPVLREALDFLMSEQNRGKEWKSEKVAR